MAEDPQAGADRFTEQARWLIAFHDARGESFCTRAVALLGFVGVTLALLLRGGLPANVTANCGIKASFSTTVGFLILTSVMCLATLMGRTLKTPGAKQIRKNWELWVTAERRQTAATDIAETFLLAKDLDKMSPLEWVIQTAQTRARYFGAAVWLMFVSLLSLTLLLCLVGAQVYF